MRHVYFFTFFFVMGMGCRGSENKNAVAPSVSSASLVKETETGSPTSQSLVAETATYRERLAKALRMLENTQDRTLLTNEINPLFDSGLTITRLVAQNRATCAAYLEPVFKLGRGLLQLSAEEIEAGYHKDANLPKTNDPLCYHAKDLAVHPATVLILIGQTPQGSKTDMIRELVELTGHLETLRSSFSDIKN